MSELIITERSKLVAIADAVRANSDIVNEISLDEIAGGVDYVASYVAANTDSNPVLQNKTVTPTTSSQTITADSGYDGLNTVTVNAMSTATQATPSITVSSSGLITASATQSAGYVGSGTKTATKQLSTQSAKTITPSVSSQTAVASGKYTTGAVTVAGDANLKAENIAEGVSIFGIEGSHSGGGSGGGSSTAGEWIEIRSLPTMLAAPDGDPDDDPGMTLTTTFYLELDTNVKGVLFVFLISGYWQQAGIAYWRKGRYVSPGVFAETLTVDSNLSSLLTITDVSTDGIKILSIAIDANSPWYALPIYAF